MVGNDSLADDVAAAVQGHPEYGLGLGGHARNVEDALDALALGAFRRVILCGRQDEGDVATLEEVAGRHGVSVWRLASATALHGQEDDELWGYRLHRLSVQADYRQAWRVKRVADAVIAGSGLILLAPFLAAMAVAVRLGSPGPVLFRQVRVGQGALPFTMLKFRTLRMAPAAIDLREHVDEVAIQASRRKDVDGRSTRVGSFLRATGLDELPQLWNVVRGDMSLVGVRPEELHYAARFAKTVPGYEERHRLPAGLTGWAQVHGLRGDTSIVDRVRFDNDYIERWSVLRDFTILLRTVSVVLGRARPPEDQERAR